MEFQNPDKYLLLMIGLASKDPPTPISPTDLTNWSGSARNDAFYNSIALNLARRYRAGTLSYSVCGTIVNDLWSVLGEYLDELALPSPFFEIFIAFDAGEFHRMADSSDNPEQDYTIPMIDNVLRNFP